MGFIQYIDEIHKDKRLSRQEYLTLRLCFFKNNQNVLQTKDYIEEEFTERVKIKLENVIKEYILGRRI